MHKKGVIALAKDNHCCSALCTSSNQARII